MPKQKAFIHIGLPHSGGDVLAAALAEHADALGAQGVRQPAKSADEMFHAAVEIRRDHKSWGLRRKDVEGVWSNICRRAYRTKDTVVVSHDLLAGCSPDEIALLVDRLPGFAIHIVATASAPDARVSLFPDDHDLGEVLHRWTTAVKSPDRVHVVIADPADLTSAWRAWGDIVGFDAAALRLPDPTAVRRTPDTVGLRLLVGSTGSLASHDDLAALGAEWSRTLAHEGYDVHGDPALLAPSENVDAAGSDDRVSLLTEALSESVAELTRLRERTRDLTERNRKLERKRLKLKRKLAEAG